jgi:hypothetical protein
LQAYRKGLSQRKSGNQNPGIGGGGGGEGRESPAWASKRSGTGKVVFKATAEEKMSKVNPRKQSKRLNLHRREKLNSHTSCYFISGPILQLNYLQAPSIISEILFQTQSFFFFVYEIQSIFT